MTFSCGKSKQEPKLTKEQKRNVYTKDCSVFKSVDGESKVIHLGQTGFKTKSKGYLAGLKTNEKGRTPSTLENNSKFHNFVIDDVKKLGLDENAIYKNVDYTTRNQPTQKVTVFLDKATNNGHLFKQTLDEKGNQQWVTVIPLDRNQYEDLI